MKIISDCWRHIALNDIDPDDIQRRPREGSNVEVQRRVVSERKDKIEKLGAARSVNASNLYQVVSDEPDKTLDNPGIATGQSEQTVQYL